MGTAAIYCRVSTRQQADDGSSLNSQEEACIKVAKSKGLEFTTFKEDFPGTELQRPMLDELRAGIKAKRWEAVICYATDRLSRSPVHLALIAEECNRHDVVLFFVSEPLDNSPEGQLLTFVRGWAAQLEREKIKDRTIRGKVSRMREGKLPQGTGRTGTAFGYRYNKLTGKREILDEDAAVVREIFDLCAGGMSPHRIAVNLNRDGIPSPMGFLWDPRTVRFILRNEIYAGKTYFSRTKRVHVGGKRHVLVARPQDEWVEIQGATPAIIDVALFQRVQDRLSRPFRVQVGTKVGTKYLLQGFVSCSCGGAVCGATMSGGHAAGPFYYYRCLNTRSRPARPKSCTALNVRMETLDRLVWEEVKSVILDPSIVLSELQRRQGSPQAILDEIAKHERILKSLGDQKQRVVRLYRFGELDDETIDAELKKINKMTADVEATIKELSGRAKIATDFEPIAQRVTRYCASIADQLESFTFADKREVLEALQTRVTVDAGSKDASIFCVIPADDGSMSALHASGYMSRESIAGIPHRKELGV